MKKTQAKAKPPMEHIDTWVRQHDLPEEIRDYEPAGPWLVASRMTTPELLASFSAITIKLALPHVMPAHECEVWREALAAVSDEVARRIDEASIASGAAQKS